MRARGLNKKKVMRIARSLGLDTGQLQNDMQSEEISAAIYDNVRMAAELRINGIPAFVIGDTMVPGALEMHELRKLVAAARS